MDSDHPIAGWRAAAMGVATKATPTSRRWRMLAALVCFVIAGGILRRSLGVEWSPEGVRTLVGAAGVWAPIIFALLLTFRVFLVLPSVILLPAGGILFGVVEGSIYATIGLVLSGLLNYGLVRWAGSEAFRARISSRFQALLGSARSKGGVGAVAVVTAYPVGPITVVHLAAAAAGMSLASFLTAVTIGSIVRSTTFSLFGASLLDSDRLLWASLAMVGALVIPLLVPRSRAWLRQSFGIAASGAGDGPTADR